jgi:hypothetical protein
MHGPFGVYSATPPALRDKEQVQLQLNSDGSLKVGSAGHGLIVSGHTSLVTRRLLQRPAIRRFHPKDKPMRRKG